MSLFLIAAIVLGVFLADALIAALVGRFIAFGERPYTHREDQR